MEKQPETSYPLRKREKNLLAAKKHRSDVWWQILVPSLIFLGLLIWAADFVINSGDISTGSLSQIGTMFILLPLILLGGIFLALTIVLIYLLAIVMQWIPLNSFWLQKQISRLNYRIQDVSDLAAEPFLRLDSWSDAASKLFNRFK
jgi:hypothetical protein